MNIKLSLTAFRNLDTVSKGNLRVIKSFTKNNGNGNPKIILICQKIVDESYYRDSLKLSKARKAPKKLGKPSKHVFAKEINARGAKPKIVTGNMFPSKANVIHFEPQGENPNRYIYDAYKVFLKPKANN